MRSPRPVSGRSDVLVTAAFVAAVVYALSWFVSGFDWMMFDDDINILFNPHLGRGFGTASWAFTDLHYIRRYVPLGWGMFEALLRIDGYNATVFHAVAVWVHALNAALAFLVFRKLIDPPAMAENEMPARRQLSLMWAAIASIAWSVHPLRAENVGWISGLFYLVSTTFALVAVWVLLPGSARGERIIASALGAAAFTISLLVYPVYLALPAVLTLWIARRRPGFVALRDAARQIWLWWVAALVVCALNGFAAFTATGAFARTATHLSTVAAFTGMVKALGLYAAHTVLPWHLTVYYGPASAWLRSPADAIAAGGVVFVLLVLSLWRTACAAAARTMVMLVVALAPFLAQFDATFTPSDRYAVLWLGVTCVAIAQALAAVRRPMFVAAAMSAAVAVTTLLALQYRGALRNWHDTETLQRSIDERNAAWPNPKLNFGRPALELWWLGRGAEARARLEAGLRIFPRDSSLLEDELLLQGLEERWRARVGRRTDIPPIAAQHVDLGNESLAAGAPAAALAHYKAALVLAPNYGEAARAVVQLSQTTTP